MYRFESIASRSEDADLNELFRRVEAGMNEGLLPVEVFCDDKVFRAEMERIFARTWVFVAHESELPKSGDFVLRKIGLDQVIVVRDDTGRVNVLLNHCRHRGSEVCHEDSGHATYFKCPYHGWVYKTNGDWAGAPHLADAYTARLDARKWGLLRAPNVESIHGFIFAALSEDVAPLRTHLGGAVWMLDAIFGLHPGGMRAVGPPERFQVRADWKSGAENFCGDAYHVGTTHLSTSLSKFIPGDVRATSSWARGYDFGNGNSFIGHALREWFGPPFELWGYPPEVRAEFDLSRFDQAQIDMITHVPPTIGTLFPNFSYLRFPQPAQLGDMPVPFTNIRMWQPLAPGVMELWTWEFEYACVPPEFARKTYAAGQFGFGSAGIFEQDDTVVWEGIAKAAKSPWNRKHGTMLHYQQRRPEADPDWRGPGKYFGSIYGEYLQEQFWRRWLEDMRAEAHAASGGAK